MFLAALSLATLGGASTAAAATGTATVSLSPDTASAHSTAQVTLSGLGGFGGLPTAAELLLPPGFTSSVRAVTTLCRGGTSSGCPPASQIGSGSLDLSVLGTAVTVPAAIYLGPPTQPGDLATVIIIGSVDGHTFPVAGRLFTPAGGGLEVLLSFETVPPPYNALPLSSISVTLGASQTVATHVTKTVTKTVYVGKGKHRRKRRVKRKVTHTVRTVYSLITNPTHCTGTWTGMASLTFATGTDALPLIAPCSA